MAQRGEGPCASPSRRDIDGDHVPQIGGEVEILQQEVGALAVGELQPEIFESMSADVGRLAPGRVFGRSVSLATTATDRIRVRSVAGQPPGEARDLQAMQACDDPRTATARSPASWYACCASGREECVEHMALVFAVRFLVIVSFRWSDSTIAFSEPVQDRRSRISAIIDQRTSNCRRPSNRPIIAIGGSNTPHGRAAASKASLPRTVPITCPTGACR